VLYLKLLTGEDLIASVEVFEDEVLIKKPLQLVFQGDHIKFLSWIPLYDDKSDEFMIRKDHVLLSKRPPTHIQGHYERIWEKDALEKDKPFDHTSTSNTGGYTVH
jgi:hypothetical protein